VFLIVDRGYSDYYYRPKYADTNGVIDTFYFGQQENITLANKGKADSAVINIDENRINKGSTRYIWVKDDDGLVRGGRFVVFADSAPPRPTDFNGMQPVSDSVVLKWNKVQDYKDGMQTKVQILYCYNSGCTPTDSLFPSNALPTLTEIESRWGTASGGTWNVVKLKKDPTKQTGTFGRWRVILVDARGTASECTEGCPATFEVP